MEQPPRPKKPPPSRQYLALARKRDAHRVTVRSQTYYDSMQSTRDAATVLAARDIHCGCCFWRLPIYIMGGTALAIPICLVLFLVGGTLNLCLLLGSPAFFAFALWFSQFEPRGDPYWGYLVVLQRLKLWQEFNLMPISTARTDFPVEKMHPKRTLKKQPIPFTGGLVCPVANEEEFESARWITPDKLLDCGRLLFLGAAKRFSSPTSFAPTENPVEWAMKLVSSVYPTIVQEWTAEEKESDEGLARFCRDGLGAHRVEAVPDGHPDRQYGQFVLRTNVLARYETRPGLATYGGDIFLEGGVEVGSQWRVTCIVRDEKPPGSEWWAAPAPKVYTPDGSHEWNYAKFCARSSVLSLVTMIDHLYNCHWLQANAVTIATRESLSASHPVRRFLVPFQFGTISINKQAASGLAAWMSTVPRLFAFTKTGLAKAYADAPAAIFAEQDSHHSVRPMLHRRAEALGTPFLKYALRFYDTVEGFVTQYVDTFYASAEDVAADVELSSFLEQLVAMRAMADVRLQHTLDVASMAAAEKRRVVIDLISTFIFHVTMMHEQVGSVQVYVQDVSWASFHWKEGEPLGTKEAAYGGAILMALTSTPMPKLMVAPGGPRDWTFLYPAEGERLEALRRGFADFQSKLERLESDVEGHNKANPHAAVFTANPRFLETSVSV